MMIDQIELQEPVLQMTLKQAETDAQEAARIEIFVKLVAEPDAASRPPRIEADEEPTWEDAEWQ